MRKLLIMLVVMLLPFTVFAEENTYNPELGSITISYYDDSDKKVPVENSTWRLFKVADIVTVPGDDEMDGLRIESLIPDLEITRETTTGEVMEKIIYDQVNESTIKINGTLVDEKADKLYYYEETTDKKGKATFKDLSFGVYFGVEVQAAQYHLVSEPFLVSIPNTEDGKTSLIDLEIEPKAIIGGNLLITKELKGNRTDKYTDWEMTVSLPDGKYRFDSTNGQKGVVKNQDKIKIKGGETLTIYDVLSGSNYVVSETKANQDGYSTTYNNEKNTIKFKDDQKVTVTNTRNWEYNPIETGTFYEELASGNPFAWAWLIVPGAIIVLLLIVIVKTSKKNKK